MGLEPTTFAWLSIGKQRTTIVLRWHPMAKDKISVEFPRPVYFNGNDLISFQVVRLRRIKLFSANHHHLSMSTDLALELSDPLNLLLHNNEDSANEESETQAWSKFGSMWSDASFKPYPDLMDSTDSSMALDMDYSAIGIDPSSLQFNPCALNLAFDEPMSSATFGDPYPTFSFQYPPATQAFDGSPPQKLFSKERRLSVTSSSSGASLSSMRDTASSPPSGYTSDSASTKEEAKSIHDVLNPYTGDPAVELAQRVRQAAGIMLAVPMNGFAANFQGASFHVNFDKFLRSYYSQLCGS